MPRFWQVGELRFLIPLSALVGLFVVPEGLAVPFGDSVGASTAEVGLLLAAMPLGGAVGALWLVRVISAERRMPTAVLMAIGCGLPLLASGFAPPWPVAMVCWFVSGVLAAYQVEVNSAVVEQIPERVRAAWVGIYSSCLLGAQGIGIALFGAVAEWSSPGLSITIAAAIGSGIAVVIAVRRRMAVNSNGARRHEPAGAALRGIAAESYTGPRHARHTVRGK
jgi:MFS family permease